MSESDIAKLTPKQRKFARKYVQNNGNGAQSAIEAGYQVSTRHAARAIASENLTKPVVISEIERLFAEQGMELSDVVKIHKRNMTQSKHLPTSQRALETWYEMSGRLKKDTPSVSVSFNMIREESSTPQNTTDGESTPTA
jgi:phage terminase small subunit